MTDGVGDRLLQDAVGGLVGGGGQLHRRRGHLELDVEPGLARQPHQLLDLVEAWGWRPPVVAGVAQHPQGGTQLAQRPGAGLLDHQQRLARLLGSLVQHVGGDTCLDVDDGDGVGDGVVDLPGDPKPLGVHPPPRLLLLGLFGPLRALQRLGRQGPPGADRLAERGRHDGPADPEEHPSGGVERLQVGRDQPNGDEQDLACRDDVQRPAPVALRHHGIDADEQPDPSRPVGIVGRVVHHAARHGHGGYGHRPAAPHDQHQAAHGQQQVPQVGRFGQGPRQLLVDRHHAGPLDLEPGHEDREQTVLHLWGQARPRGDESHADIVAARPGDRIGPRAQEATTTRGGRPRGAYAGRRPRGRGDTPGGVTGSTRRAPSIAPGAARRPTTRRRRSASIDSVRTGPTADRSQGGSHDRGGRVPHST
jgi:hypothetical protein